MNFRSSFSELTEQVSLDVDAYVPQCNSASSFRNARALLRQYLQVGTFVSLNTAFVGLS